MGLFDKIIKKTLSSAVGEALENVIEKVEDKTGLDLTPDEAAKSETGRTAASTAASSAASAAAPVTIDKDYFAKILAENFSEYEVKQDISPASLGGGGRNLDFGLYKGGTLKGVVVLVEHNRDNNKAYKDAKATCASKKIPFINFYLHMPNEKDFVIYRIGHMLG